MWGTVSRWVDASVFTPAQFLARYSNVGKELDGLFLWLASVSYKRHINYVHSSQVWTSQSSECPDTCDAAIIYVENGFLAASSINAKETKAEGCDYSVMLLIQQSTMSHTRLCYSPLYTVWRADVGTLTSL